MRDRIGATSSKLEIEEMIARIDELIPGINDVDPLSGNLLITARTLLWGKIQLHGHPCNGCLVRREINSLATQ